MSSREAFVTALAVLGATFDKKLSPAAIEGYWIALGELSESEFGAATKRALSSSKFMPSPSELLAFARPRRDLVHETAIAWAAVRRAIDRIDYTVSFIDFGPHVNAVVRQLGGWEAMCTANLTDLDVWKRKEFERLYLALADRPLEHMGKPLEGPREGRVYGPRTVAIPGLPSQPLPPQLEPVGHNGTGRDLIKALADDKTLEPLK